MVVNEGGDGTTVSLRGPKLLFALRAFLWLWTYRPDVVHAHSHWHTLFPGVVFRSLRKTTRLVFTVHTPIDLSTRPITGRVIMGLLKRCDVVTTVSREMASRLRPRLPPRVTLTTIPPGGDHREPDHRGARRTIRVPTDVFLVAFVGPLLWPEKAAGVELLIRAFRGFLGDARHSMLVIVGGGPYLSRLRTFASNLGIESQVSFTGIVPDATPFVDACDVYAHISYMEGVPLSLLEAMSAGKAIIASRVGGIPDLLSDGESAILVQNAEGEIVRALDLLHRDQKTRARLGAMASHVVRSEHTWDKVAARFSEVYQGREGE